MILVGHCSQCSVQGRLWLGDGYASDDVNHFIALLGLAVLWLSRGIALHGALCGAGRSPGSRLQSGARWRDSVFADAGDNGV